MCLCLPPYVHMSVKKVAATCGLKEAACLACGFKWSHPAVLHTGTCLVYIKSYIGSTTSGPCTLEAKWITYKDIRLRFNLVSKKDEAVTQHRHNSQPQPRGTRCIISDRSRMVSLGASLVWHGTPGAALTLRRMRHTVIRYDSAINYVRQGRKLLPDS